MEYGIGELAALAGVSARTLRYYDEIGLLKPGQVNSAGYRTYGDKEVMLLQQILFYRERGFELKQIHKMIHESEFDILTALQDHLKELERQRDHMENLIRTVEKTIASVKGEAKMSDKDKFEALKARAVEENETKYGEEARAKYGADQVEASYGKMRGMTEEQWQHFQWLEQEIVRLLETGVKNGITAESEEAGTIVKLHKEWIMMTWKQYSPEAHKGLGAMYVADERFKAYYDRNVEGCAALLKQSIQHWA